MVYLHVASVLRGALQRDLAELGEHNVLNVVNAGVVLDNLGWAESGLDLALDILLQNSSE